MLSKWTSERVRKRFSGKELPQLPGYIMGEQMNRVKIELSSSGIVLNNVEFQVLQGDRVLVEDSLSGKISDVFIRHYDVSADGGPVSVRFTKGDIPGLNVKAALS